MNNTQHIVKIIDENVNEIEALIQQKVDIWFDYIVFSPLWWFGVAFSIIPWIIWIFFHKKESRDRLLYSGFVVMVISIVLDVLGDQWALWHYRFNVVPVLPTYLPWDLTLMPVTILYILQFKPNASPFLKAIFFALLTSYIGEPFFQWMKVYHAANWKFTYSVPIQMIIYFIAHFVSTRKNFSELK
ncbi:hypothetical protein OEV98_06260 [Caldibacillus lycopersici]|uniref:Uncharacterized protein n=1 Tax=Perspicuibacillus lycopersici TaxID=1325689 RepID=A0AAE3IUM3_9BACI|nr:CBO0543 family protein [Perspicuibacillus lycopersici]MCU9613154.1 hypothetical protein [Perspicuibacillus lycopersici]